MVAQQVADPMKMFRCDACQIGMTRLSEDVTFLIQRENAWLKEDLLKRVDMMCQDPAMNDQYGKEQCWHFLKEFRTRILRMVRERQDPDSEFFEEGMMPIRQLCGPTQWGVCVEGQKTLNEMMASLPSGPTTK